MVERAAAKGNFAAVLFFVMKKYAVEDKISENETGW